MKRYIFFLACGAVLAACGSPATQVASPSVEAATLPTTASVSTEISPTVTLTPSATDTLALPSSTPAASLDIGSTHVSPTTGMMLVYVPPGEFLRGSSDADPQSLADEQPQRALSLDGFWMDQTEVTNAMFATFLSAQGNLDEAGTPWMSQDAQIKQKGDKWTPVHGYEDHPVVNITWYAARAYCAWAGERLPTEAEWEKAARGVGGSIYPWGDDPDPKERLNFADSNSEGLDWSDPEVDDGYARTSPVGNYPSGASPYQVLDMAGNVWEWTADWYGDTYYALAPADNPPGSDDGSLKIARGGSWQDPMLYTRSAYRSGFAPASTVNTLGFRCVTSEALPSASAPNKFSDLPHATLRTGEHVSSFSWSPDGKYLAAGGGALYVWDIKAGDFFYIRSEKRSFSGVVYSPDGYLLATSYSNSGLTRASVGIWGAQSGNPRQNLLVGEGALWDIDWSPDGRFVASAGSSGQVFVWDTTNWERKQILNGRDETAEHNDILALAFSPDSSILAGASMNHIIFLWDTATWKKLATLDGHTDDVRAVAWSPDGSILASGSSDQRIILWNTATWEILQTFTQENFAANDLSWSPDGSILASTAGKNVNLWDVASGERIGELSAHIDWVYALAFSSDGRILASGSADDTMILWYMP